MHVMNMRRNKFTKKENVKKQQMICKITGQKKYKNQRAFYIIETPSTLNSSHAPRKAAECTRKASFKNESPT
jgi:hypothetical protein